MSWILVIPFDVIKTIVQAETDPNKHGDMAQIFKAKSLVSCSLFKKKGKKIYEIFFLVICFKNEF